MAEDKRIRQSKERIRLGMLECLKTTSLDKITVKQLCDSSKVNRSTFYSHFSSPYDVYRLLEQEMTDKLYKPFTGFKNRNVSYMNFLRLVLQCFYDNSELFLVLHDTDSASLKSALLDLIKNYDSLRDPIPIAEKAYVFDYYINGILSVITRWLREDRTRNIDDVTRLLFRLTYRPD